MLHLLEKFPEAHCYSQSISLPYVDIGPTDSVILQMHSGMHFLGAFLLGPSQSDDTDFIIKNKLQHTVDRLIDTRRKYDMGIEIDRPKVMRLSG